jgi:hypothetical protein
VAVLIWLFYQIDIYRAIVQWQGTEWRYVILLGPPVSFACLLINILRWYLILEHQGLHPPLMNVAAIYTKGVFFASFLPGGMTTGDLFRIHLLTKKTQDLDASIKSVFLDRVSGFFGLLMVVIGALLYSSFETNDNSLRPYLKPVIVVVFLFLAITVGPFLLRQRYFQKPHRQYPFVMKVRSFLDVIPKYFEDKRLMLRQLVLSLTLQLVIVGWAYIVSRALHISVSFEALSIATPLVTFFSLLPISLGGVGVREAGYVFFLVPFGLTPGEATSLSLVSGLTQDGLRLIYGLIFYWDPWKESATVELDGQPSRIKSIDGI